MWMFCKIKITTACIKKKKNFWNFCPFIPCSSLSFHSCNFLFENFLCKFCQLCTYIFVFTSFKNSLFSSIGHFWVKVCGRLSGVKEKWRCSRYRKFCGGCGGEAHSCTQVETPPSPPLQPSCLLSHSANFWSWSVFCQWNLSSAERGNKVFRRNSSP